MENKNLWFPDGVPDTWRSTLLKYMPKACMPLIERINEAFNTNKLDPYHITIPQVRELNATEGWGLSKHTIDEGFKQTENVFFRKLPPKELKSGGNNQKKLRGRPSSVYQALEIKAIIAALRLVIDPKIHAWHHPIGKVLPRFTPAMLQAVDVKDVSDKLNQALEPAFQAQGNQQAEKLALEELNQVIHNLRSPYSTPLLDAHYTNGADFRSVHIRSIMADNPDESWTRKELSTMMGITERSVNPALRRAGVESYQQFAYLPLNPHEDLAHQVRAGRWKVRGYPRCVVIGSPEQPISKYPWEHSGINDIIQGASEAGEDLFIEYQIQNRQEVVREAILERRRSPGNGQRNFVPQPVAPRPVAKQGGYDPQFVIGHLKYALCTQGWEERLGCWFNNITGEYLRDNLSPDGMVALLIGTHPASIHYLEDVS